jgi:hypothetical protein
MACRDGLKLALQRGFQRVVVETDCLQVVQLWNKVETERSIIDPVLREISDPGLPFKSFRSLLLAEVVIR